MNACLDTVLPDLVRYATTRASQLKEINNRITSLRSAEAAPSKLHAGQSRELADLLLENYMLTGELICIDESVRIYRLLLADEFLDPLERIRALNGLGNAIPSQRTDSPDIASRHKRERVEIHREALSLCRSCSENPFDALLGLARALNAQVSVSWGQNTVRTPASTASADIPRCPSEATLLLDEAKVVCPCVPQSRCALLLALCYDAIATWARYHASCDDVHEVRALWKEALQVLDSYCLPGAPAILRMGDLLNYRLYVMTSDTAYLGQAISCLLCALEITRFQSNPRDWAVLSDLCGRYVDANAHQELFQEDCLDVAVSFGRAALTRCPPRARGRSYIIEMYQRALRSRCTIQNRLDDMTEGITVLRNEVGLGNLQGHDVALARWLRRRWSMTGDHADLDDAVQILQSVSMTVAPSDIKSAAHFHLTTYLLDRYNIEGNSGDLEAAVQTGRIAIQLFDEHGPHTLYAAASRLGLADALLHHTRVSFDIALVEEGISLGQEVIARCLNIYPETLLDAITTVMRLLNVRLEKHGDLGPSQMDDLVNLYELGSKIVGQHKSPDRGALFHEVSLVQLSIYATTGCEEHRLPSSCLALRECLSDDTTIPRRQHLSYALEWITKAKGVLSPKELHSAYSIAVSLLAQVAYIGMERTSRLRLLRKSEGLAVSAAMNALSMSENEQALLMIEQGHATFWQQTLGLRTPYDDLPEDIARALSQIAIELDRVPATGMRVDVAQSRLQLSVEFEGLLHQARQIPGHERLFLPPLLQELKEAGREGPVVIFLADEAKSKAFILPSRDEALILVHLDITIDVVQRWVHRFETGNSNVRSHMEAETGDRHILLKSGRRRVRDDYIGALAEIWHKAVLPVIERLGFQKRPLDNERPRIWFYPLGAFSFIPLHAAGIYVDGPDDNSLSHYAVCSYTPTLSILNDARSKSHTRVPGPVDPAPCQMMLVAEAQAHDLRPLPNALEEVAVIQRILPPECHIPVGTPDGRWTIDRIIEMISGVSVLHLACHGQQDTKNALQSGFYIGDKKLTIEEIMQLKIPDAQLAFLSACETAKGDAMQPDEAIHLAAAMMFVGFPSVIGTMWSMNDTDGPQVSKMVYARIFRDGILHVDEVPFALDAAVRHLQEQGVHPSRWATYIHMGI